MEPESTHKKWKKEIKGNSAFADTVNPLRNFIEKVIPSININDYPNRPVQKVNLSIGDPNISPAFRTNPENLQTIVSNIGKVDGYTDTQGLLEARQALAEKYKVSAYNISEKDVFMCSGGSLAIWASMMLLANEGDNFLFPSPGFPLALVIAKSMKVIPRFYNLQSDNGWKADLKQMESLIDERTRFIYVNDPSNPLGSCWSVQHKLEILQLCRKKNLPLIADEIYEGVTYEEPIQTFASYSKNDVTIFKCSGLTKRWLGPGWRLGWIIVYAKEQKAEIYRKNLKNIFNIVLMPHNVMQSSVKTIINNPTNQKHLTSKLQIMKTIKNILVEGLEGEEYCKFGDAQGALYATILIDLKKLKGFADMIQFCKELYAEQNIMIFPGEFFVGKVHFIRLVISCEPAIIEEFLRRFKKFCRSHLETEVKNS